MAVGCSHQLFAYEDMGCYVVDRETGKKVLESMPLYVRVGMHLLFVEGVSGEIEEH